MTRALHMLLKRRQTLKFSFLMMILWTSSAQMMAQDQFVCQGEVIDDIQITSLVLEQGQDMQVGAVYRQVNCYPNVDALVTITQMTNGVSLDALDYDGHGHHEAFQPILNIAGGNSQGFVDFSFEFVDHQTGLPTTIDHIMYSAIDIDGDNPAVEYVKLTGVDSYRVDQNTDLQVVETGDGVKFIGPTFSESLNLSHSWINGTVNAYNTSGFTFRCGISGSSNDISRHFALYFRCLDYNNPEISIVADPPVAHCKNIEVELDDNGVVNLNSLQLDNGSTSETDFTAALDIEHLNYTNVGDNVVTLTVTDAFGRESSCTANVIVTNRAPDIICPDDITTNTNSGCYRSGLDIGMPVINSNIPIASVTNDAPDQFIVGSEIVTWTVVDALGESATCVQNITIVDDLPPTFVPCVSDVTVYTDPDDCDFGTLLQAPVVSDNCGIESLTSDTDYPLPLGVTTITWTVVDPSGLSATCIQNVDVIDNTPPEIICPSEVVVPSQAGVCGFPGELTPPSVSDACGIASITSNAPATIPVGSTEVTWTITDNNGNASTCTQLVIVEDNNPPTIICPEDVAVFTAGSSQFVNVGQPTYADDCGIASYSNSFNNTTDASGTYPLGTTAVQWTVIDINGNESTCVMTVTVTDNEAPPINCPNNIDVNAANGLCGADVSIDIPTVVGGEDLASLINDYNNSDNASGFYPVGQTVVIWTATDVNGNESTCSMLVQVDDNDNPAISCPSDINENASGGSCDANVVELGVPVVSDACGIAGIATNNAPDVFPVGTTDVIWTVTDVNGNTSTCVQSVTLMDDTPPTIQCPSDVLASADPGLPSAFISIPLPNAFDDCGIESYVNSFNGTSNASDVYPIGVTEVTWTVTDNNGNSASCTMIVTVEDTEGPTISCPPNVDVDANATLCETQVTIQIPSVSDNDGIASIVNDFNGTNNASGVYPVGTTVVLWTVTDVNGLESSCSMSVTVNDVTTPVIVCANTVTVDVDANACEATNVSLTPPTANDACGVATVVSNAPATYPVGVNVVTWTVTDNNGNVSTCDQTIIVEDNTSPLINCPPNVSVNTDPGTAVAAVTVALATATDDCGIESIVNDITGTNNASGVYPIGTTLVTWVATDVNGNTATCTMTVTVSDGEAPVVTCPENPSVTAQIGLCEAFVNVDIASASDNNGIQSLTNDFTGTNDASGIYPVGTTTVTWTAIDFEGNSSTCTMTVTVLDETPPVINCPSDISATVDQGECGSATVTLNNPSVSDECGLVSVATNNAPNFYPIGETTVTWSVTDVNGNTSTCDQTVNITDDLAPTIECPSNITVSTDPGVNTAFVTVGVPVVSDNCGIESLTNDFNNTGNATDTYPQGVTIVTWEVVDIYGNTATCSMTVNVIDDEAPPLPCPPNVDVDAAMDECEAMVTIEIPVVEDNDGIQSLVNDFNGTNDASGIYPVGTTVVVWTVTDNSGNSNSCSMTVTVNDVTPPNLTCPEQFDVFSNAESCDATEVNIGGVNVNDACGIAGMATNDAPETFPVGSTIVTWTAIDNSGNVSACETNVIVEDNVSPIVDCPLAVTVGVDAGLCSATGVDLGNVTATDNCAIAEVTNNAQEPFPIGVTTVTWTVTDNNGNATTCDQEVTVVDDEAPPVLEPGDLTIEADLGFCSADGIVLDDLIVDDNCFGEVTVSNNLSDFSPLPVGTTTITWTIVDANGNVTTVTQDIIVVDAEPPTIICPDDITVDNEFRECWQVVEVDVPTAADNCGINDIINDYNNTTNATDTFNVGVTPVVWTVIDVNGNPASCTQVITVVDTEDPSLACPPNVAVANDPGFCGAEVVVQPALASDNCAMDVLYNDYNNTGDASDYYIVGETPVVWTAIDINGNEFTCSMNVTVVDTELPEITCPDDITVVADLGTCEADLIVSQPQVTDNCEVSFINELTGTDNASGTFTGETEVVWVATDASGNQASCTQIITVLDEEPPVINCPSDMIVENDSLQCGAIVNYPEITFTDNCGIDTMIVVTGFESGTYMEVGDTTLTFEVFDTSGNSATCSFNISVIDTEAPQIICPDSIMVIDSATVVFYDAVEVMDNCSYEVVQIDGLASGDIFPHGITTNTFIVTDEGGLTDECSFDVLVNLPPVAVDDVITVSVTGSEVEVHPLDNDYDPDDDPFSITDYTVDLGEVILVDGEIFIYNAPEDWCGLATINYTICDTYDACDDANILIYVNCPEELFIPEGISPDGDGINDVFEIIGLWQYPDNHLTVYNRWGHEIFEMDHYDNSWDGTSQSDLTLGSKPVPRGTYFYILDLGKDEEPIKGFVYVLNR